MLPFGIGFSEVILIFIVALVVVGPEKLPEAARFIGRALKVVRQAFDEIRHSAAVDEFKREIYQPMQKARSFDPIEHVKHQVKEEVNTLINNESPLHQADEVGTKGDLSIDRSIEQDDVYNVVTDHTQSSETDANVADIHEQEDEVLGVISTHTDSISTDVIEHNSEDPHDVMDDDDDLEEIVERTDTFTNVELSEISPHSDDHREHLTDNEQLVEEDRSHE